MIETNDLMFRLYNNLSSATYERCFKCCEKAGTIYEECGTKCINPEENCEVRKWLETLSMTRSLLQESTSC